MYEQAIMVLRLEALATRDAIEDYQKRLENNPLDVCSINMYNDWKSRRKEMLLAIECLEEDNR